MKKIIKNTVIIILIAAVCISLPAGAAESTVNVVVDGKPVEFPDAKPFIDSNGRTLIPVRFVAEKLGAEVGWNGKEKKVTIKNVKVEIILYIGQSDIIVNGQTHTMDTAAILENSRTYVPIRYVAEALGAKVGWEGATRTVVITTDKGKSGDKKDGDEPFGGYGVRPNDTDPNIVWSYIVEGSYVYYASPALSSDEKTVYIGTSFAIKSPQSDYDRLIALNTDGTLKWEYSTNKGEIRSSLKVYKDNIYFIAEYGRYADEGGKGDGSREKAELIAVSPNGDELWRKTVAGSSGTYPFGRSGVDAANDKVVVVTDHIYVFDYLTGRELDKEAVDQDPNRMQYVRPVIHNNSAWFLLNGILYEYDLETSSLSKKALSDISPDLTKVSGSNDIRFDSDNNMYIGAGSYLISLDKNKNHRWTYSESDKASFRSSPAISESSRLLYIGTKNDEDSKLLAINIDTGKPEWSYSPGGDVYCSPALYNGLIYTTAEKGYMHILKEDGTLVQIIFLNQEVTWPSPVIDSQGILYTAGMGDVKSKGFVYAIKTLTPDE